MIKLSTGILQIVKEAALDAVESSNPVKVVFGTVTKAKPLEVKLDSTMTLSQSAGQLKLTRNVTDYEVEMTIDHATDSKETFKVHNALTVGEMVVMLKMQGGQAYVVLDRVG